MVQRPKEAAHMPTTAARRRQQMFLYIMVTGEPNRLACALATICTNRRALGPQTPVVSTAKGMNSHPAREQASEYLATLEDSARLASTEGDTPLAKAAHEVRSGCVTVTSMARGLPALKEWTNKSAGRREGKEVEEGPGGRSGGSVRGTCSSEVTKKPALRSSSANTSRSALCLA